MTNQESQPEGKQIVATGNVSGNHVEVRVVRGDAVLLLSFDAGEDLDELGLGSVDYLIAALPEAAEQVMNALEAEREKQEAAGE